MENKEMMWKVVGAVAVVSIIASAGMIYGVVAEVNSMIPTESNVLEEVLKAMQTTDASHARE